MFLQFNDIYRTTCELILDCGRKITLDSLTQKRTYAGLQVGHPSKDSNDHRIKWDLEYARGLPESLGDPHLIEPERRDFRVTPGDMQYVIDRQSDRHPDDLHIPEWMPEVCSIGMFRSSSPARDTRKDWSALTLVWYQADFGSDTGAVSAIRTVDWTKYAVDLEW